ncbi:Zn-ribbon protein [Colwellia psychrerythraea]|uniref:Zinc ribbon domain-containing protein n=1 Tax=Colwellia psychrerythraea TaxID=28229 RepID=A0A099KVA2_COLPS|nr:Zn-ribbon protein [Colwellia psychrerythraea]KGJ93797.1 hypothetical protein GAB14E_2352 [Colwellia psychrerythraea]
MAVINCPGCSKKISDKAKSCNHCNLDLSELDSEKLASLNRVNLINKTQRLMNYSFIAMLLFCGGFLFMFWDDVQPGSWQHSTALVCTIIGFVMYIIIRAMLLFNKRKAN